MNPSDGSWESTLSLLTRARGGDEEALEELFARYVPVMRRWAAGRLPQGLRDLTDTPDLVQDTMLQVFKKIEGFEHRGEGAFHALGAVHRAGLLHRDIKAQNAMRDADGRVLLTDFGTGRELSETTPTGAGHELAGTPLYMAPEVLDGAPASVASDVYSLGVLLYHLATGSFAVQGRSLRELREAHQQNRRPTVTGARTDIPKRLAAVIDRATDPDPLRRYASASDLEAALLASSRPRTHRAAWVAAAAVVLAVATVLATWQSRQPPAVTPAAFQVRDSVLVSRFDNSTGHSMFDGGIEYAIARELSRSDIIDVVPAERVIDALRLMKRPVETIVDRTVGREVCLRDGRVKALVTGREDQPGLRNYRRTRRSRRRRSRRLGHGDCRHDRHGAPDGHAGSAALEGAVRQTVRGDQGRPQGAAGIHNLSSCLAAARRGAPCVLESWAGGGGRADQQARARLETPASDPLNRQIENIGRAALASATGSPETAIPLLRNVLAVGSHLSAFYQIGCELLSTALVRVNRRAESIAELERCVTIAPRFFGRFNAGYRMKNQLRLADEYRTVGRTPDAERIEQHLRRLLVYADADHPIVVRLQQGRGR